MMRLSETLDHLEKITNTHKQTINETWEKTLIELEKSLQSKCKDVLTTLQDDTDYQLQRFRKEQSQVLSETLMSLKKSLEETRFHQQEAHRLLLKRWWVPIIAGFTLSLALFLGTWGGSKTLAYLLARQGRIYYENQREIKEQEWTLNLMKKGTWGMRLLEDQDGKFIVIPQGYQPGWTYEGKPCIKVGKY